MKSSLTESLLSKNSILIAFILTSLFSFGQKKIPVEYYVNNTKHPIEEISLFMITVSDTIPVKIEKGLIRFPWEFKDNFSLIAKIDGDVIKIGSYRPKAFMEVDKVVVGRITDFSTLERNWEFKDTFSISKENYLIMIPDSKDILDCIYSIAIKMVNISNVSAWKTYRPTFYTDHQVIKMKT